MSVLINGHASLKKWVEQYYSGADIVLHPLQGSAGKRRYYRVVLPTQTCILMAVPADAEVKLTDVIAVGQAFAAIGVRVPEFYHYDLEAGLLLCEDFGDALYDQVLTPENADRLYTYALEQLLKIQTCRTIANYTMPNFSDDFFMVDMQLWREWFVQNYRQTELPEAIWQQLIAILQTAILEQPSVCMHRDYHSRNLLLLPDNSVGIVDFQSAMWGPITYDAVSLLRDCYIRWPQERVKTWAEGFLIKANQQIDGDYSQQQLWRWFELTGLQRHLKALGTFARKYIRDGEASYLQDAQRTLPYILDVAGRYPELKEFHQWFEKNT